MSSVFFHQASDAGVAGIASKAIFLSFLRSGVSTPIRHQYTNQQSLLILNEKNSDMQ